MKRILITSTQRPYYGGAATNAYALIKHFRAAGYKVAGLFFDNTKGSIDPDKIGGIVRHKCDKSSRDRIRMILYGAPDVIFAKNYAAPLLSKKIFPKSTLAYLVSGAPQMMTLSARNVSAQKYLLSNCNEVFAAERKAIKVCDYVIPNSLIGRDLLVKHYGNLSKITSPVNTSLAINMASKNIHFSKRKYDIAFICSNMGRSVKNAELAKDLFSRLKTRRMAAVGIGSDMFKGVSNTECFGLLGHKEIINILSDTRLVICTSYYDASPNIIREALSCGSNILVSKNCGWSEAYPDIFVCKDVYDKREWLKKAQALVGSNVRFSSSAKSGDIISDLKGAVDE